MTVKASDCFALRKQWMFLNNHGCFSLFLSVLSFRGLTATLGITETHVPNCMTGGNPIRSQRVHSSICKANRPFTSIVVIVLRSWSPAKEHYCIRQEHADVIDYLSIQMHPLSLHYTHVWHKSTNLSWLKSLRGDWSSPTVLLKCTNLIRGDV